jgi:multisubunit Na+/H+ antiporter MnhE subunit
MAIIYDMVIVLMFVWLVLQVVGFIIGAVIGRKLWLDLNKKEESKE